MATPTVGAAPWYTSQVYIGACVTVLSTLVSLAPKFFAALGVHTSEDVSNTVTSIFSVIALLAGIYTAAKRQASTIQPLTLTAAGAESHPATVIAKEPPK